MKDFSIGNELNSTPLLASLGVHIISQLRVLYALIEKLRLKWYISFEICQVAVFNGHAKWHCY